MKAPALLLCAGVAGMVAKASSTGSGRGEIGLERQLEERSVVFTVIDDDDDAEENLIGLVSTGSGDLGFTTLVRGVGVRFQNVDVPQGAQILEAVLRFTAEEDDNDDDNPLYEIRAVNVASVDDFDSSDVVLDQPLTSNSVAFEIEPVVENEFFETPDLTSIVQEVIDRADWQPGNALGIVLERGSNGLDGNREAISFDSADSLSERPTLTVRFNDNADDDILNVDEDEEDVDLDNNAALIGGVSAAVFALGALVVIRRREPKNTIARTATKGSISKESYLEPRNSGDDFGRISVAQEVPTPSFRFVFDNMGSPPLDFQFDTEDRSAPGSVKRIDV
mmetsp:Transcript_2281/g.4352  ORF Transcript_2281/g.4352 Transcript_2281/m.4352 type:complete len:336 (+) Transcript_2281:267-1274(+)